LHEEMVCNDGKSTPANQPSAQTVQLAVIQPFKRAMVVSNPTVQQNRPSADNAEDRALLRRLNEDEPYSLLKCPHPYTLVVKQFLLPRSVEASKTTGAFGGKQGSGGANNKEDTIAVSAHELARFLQQGCKLKEVYVLHNKYDSIVTVGGFDDVNDHRIRDLQEWLPRANQQLQKGLQLLPRPAIYEVPK
jgi:hypothetical protein